MKVNENQRFPEKETPATVIFDTMILRMKQGGDQEPEIIFSIFISRRGGGDVALDNFLLRRDRFQYVFHGNDVSLSYEKTWPISSFSLMIASCTKCKNVFTIWQHVHFSSEII